MASLFVRHGIWWIDYRVDGKRFRISTGTSNKQMAIVKMEDLKVKLFKGEIGARRITGRKSTLSEFFRRYESFYEGSSKVDRHPDLSRLRKWYAYFLKNGITHLTSITPGLIDSFRSYELADNKPKTVKNYIAILKTALNKAVEWDLVEKNPVANVSLPKIVKTFHFFTEVEIKRLLETAEEPLKSGIRILVSTGMRRAELFHLRCRDIDMKNGSLRVWPYGAYTPKGKRPRTIPMTAELKGLIRDRIKSLSADDYVFRPYVSEHRLYKDFVSLLNRLKMSGTLHDLRHTFASHLAMKGVPIPVIKELLGHSDISTTMIYAHLSPGIHKAAVEKLEF